MRRKQTDSEANTDILNIPEIKESFITVQIIGDSPLVCNAFSESSIVAIEKKQTGKATEKKAPRDPELEFMEHCHIIGQSGPVARETFKDQRFGFKAIGIKKAIATAAMRFAGGQKVQMFGLVQVHGPHLGLIEIKCPGGPQMVRDMVKPPQGATMPAYRPYFDPWEMTLPIKFFAPLTLEQLVNVIRWAGISVTLGSWRVENAGDKGAFRVGTIHQYKSQEDFNEAMVRSAGLPIDGKRRFSHRSGNRTDRNGARPRNVGATG